MKSKFLFLAVLLALATACGQAADSSQAAATSAPPVPPTIFAVDTLGNLVSFRVDMPASLTTIGNISGLQTGESILGITFRPEGALYGLGSTSSFYQIDTTTAAAVAISAAPFTPPLSGSFFGFSFDSLSYQIRITSDTGSNFRLNVNDGTVLATGTPLAYISGDQGFGSVPNVVVTASSCSCDLTIPTIYGIDATAATLVRVGGVNGAPNLADSGRLTTIGQLQVALTGRVTLALPKDSPIAYSTISGPGGTNLFQVSLSTGAATFMGATSIGNQVRAIVVQPTQ